MRFSILVPVYNVERYLPDCLNSIFKQELTDFELILVDDGSTDGSGALCDEAASSDKRVRVIHQVNKGLLLARRAALDMAKGEYCICVDSDDALREDALSVVDAAIRRTNADIVCFQASRKSDFSESYLDFGDLAGSLCNTSDGSMVRVRRSVAGTHMLNQMWCKAFRLCTTDAGTDYSTYEGLQYGEDLFQTCVMFDRAQSVAFIDDVLYFYRVNMGSISHAVTPSRLKDIKIVRRCLAEFAGSWDRALIPLVHANDCVEVVAYATKLILSGSGCKEALLELSRDPFFVNAMTDADFSDVSQWKVVAARLLLGQRIRTLSAFISGLFAIVRLVAPEKAIHYV